MSIQNAIRILDDTINYVGKYNFQTQTIDEEKDEFKSNLEWPASRVRQTFIDYFVKKHQHKFIRSSSVVPLDDPTLLFTNAGMNQFKPIFLGQTTDDDPLSALKRACNSQKCIRAGGKHNDLDDVGKDTYHHTFFEMLGNWSFGDYFKSEAISMAWDLLVNIYGLDPSRIYATYFGGDSSKNLASDDEARDIWLKYLPSSRVLPFDMRDNFWEMGDTGPCGPCTEIHYDRIGNRDASSFVNADDPNVIEIWNLVFIQFNRTASGLQLLPNQHVDTGMGFERITSILQNVQSNYDTDIFVPIIEEIQKKTNNNSIKYGGKIGVNDINGYDMAYRVVADHIRTLTFAITDGAAPDKQGRNYVIRRICRRGVRYGTKLGGKPGFFKDLVDIVVKTMGSAFPEIIRRSDIVKSIIEEEETLFSRVVDHGELRFQNKADTLLKSNIHRIPGSFGFKLHTTFGFPIDLTVLMAEERGMSVNLKEYNKLMKEEKLKSLNKYNEIKFADLGDNEKTYLKNNNIAETDDSFKYQNKDINCKILAMFQSSTRKFINQISINNVMDDDDEKVDLIGIILDKTAFYAESGGQVNDIGYISDSNNDNSFKVNNVIEFGGYIIHIGEVTNGSININKLYKCNVDYNNRSCIAPNHTMTHVLNYALRKTLGTDCNQKGSLVDSDKLRFDYSTSDKLNIAQITEISQICNKIIGDKLPVYTDVISYKKVKEISALRAMFGERYPQNVRVVSIGVEPKDILLTPSDNKWFNYSIELCGGTHLSNTSEASNFIFLSDDALSSGIRRIVCLTGRGAQRSIQEANELIEEFKEASLLSGCRELSLKCSELSSKIDNAKINFIIRESLRNDLKKLNKKDKKWKKNLSKINKKKVIEIIEKISQNADTDFIIKRIDVGLDKKALKEGIKKFNLKIPIMLISCSQNIYDKNEIIICAEIPKNDNNKFNNIHCGKWIESILPFIDGPKSWKISDKNLMKNEVQGKTMKNIIKVVDAAKKYMKDNL